MSADTGAREPLNVAPEVGDELEGAVQKALEALEQAGVPARDADGFIRDCVFNAWWGWDYEVPDDG